ncbi:MAG: hypothetical protein IJL54_06450 [Prevotella sp.]|nr:hypothetical protein [Prevotella sp.]
MCIIDRSKPAVFDQNSLDGILEGSAATWGGPTAGIRHVTTKTTASENAGQCYNMAGQRVTAGTKGLLIIDGRKILHKNKEGNGIGAELFL